MIISRAPVRLSMGGGGTDLSSYYTKHGGFLMAASIDKYVNIMVNRRFDPSIRLSYSETEIAAHVGEIRHNIFREAMKSTGIDRQIELVSVADVPANCGLGTSSAFTVAVLNGLYSYKREYATREQLAEAACRIEIDVLGAPIGKQDQYASAFGGFNAYFFHESGNVTVEPVRIAEEKIMELQNSLFLFHLPMQKRSGSELLVEQDTKTREGHPGTLDRLHKIKEMGFAARKIFEKGSLDEFGDLLHEHWTTKKGLSKQISSDHIDEAYELARKNGALGGKLVGAGGGGFLLLYCPREKSKLVNAMRQLSLSPMWFSFEHSGANIVFRG